MKHNLTVFVLALAAFLYAPSAFSAPTIPLDYSYCGYRQSAVRIPDAPVKVFVPLMPGDNAGRIQKAIDYVSSLRPDKKTGLRGAVLLDAGTFEIGEALRIRTSGVVLRGKGRKQTVLLKKGVDRGAAVYIEGVDNLRIADTLDVVSDYVAVNATSMTVKGQLRQGDLVKVCRPCTKEWIDHLRTSNFGGGSDLAYWGWHEGDADVCWDRTVVTGGSTVTLDVPLTVALDRRWGSAKVCTYTWPGRIQDAGVENLTIQSDYDAHYPKDEDHCWNGVYIDAAKDCWVRLVDFRHLAGSAVIIQPGGSQVTVEDCTSREPVSEIGGHRRCTFYTLGEKVLFQRCWSEQGIHDFAAGYCAPGPNAFVQCASHESLGFSGSVSMWATGLLFDVVDIDGHDLSFRNLGLDNFGAGWSTANSMMWQCSAANIWSDDPDDDARNYVRGCWSDFRGTSRMDDSNNHVRPWSLFADQLSKRLGRDVDDICRIYPRSTVASTSPTIAQAQQFTAASRIPKVTMDMWIDSAVFRASVSSVGIRSVDAVKDPSAPASVEKHGYAVENGRLVMDHRLLVGGRHNVPWWSGRLNPNFLKRASYGITRFVPGREGLGLSDRIDSVVSKMVSTHTLMLNQNYGLWYDRRRDDHERIRRKDGEVLAPFYEQAFARSGQGKAWDGLSKYDLSRLNRWYYFRLNQFAHEGSAKGLLLMNQHYFQHNILEAGAHWVDCPWRTANNINGTGFPEPVIFSGDKRIFYADYFYDLNNRPLRDLHHQYIFQTLDALAGQPNVIHSIGEEFTGPLHFVKFWLQTIDEWERLHGQKVLVSLAVNKDVQDAVLADPRLARIVDIINVEQWYYHSKGIYAPDGGLNMAPRQYARQIKAGSVRFEDVYRAVSEYRQRYPDKAVMYYAQQYPALGLAVLFAGGSCPNVGLGDKQLLADVAQMKPSVQGSSCYILSDPGRGALILNRGNACSVSLEPGEYQVRKIDPRTGESTLVQAKQQVSGTVSMEAAALYWYKRLN